MSFKMIHFLFLFFLISYIADAFNITLLLDKYPDYSNFNSFLTQTGLAAAINSRQTITVLAVNNDNVSPLSSKSGNVLKSILSLHVILDYYDLKKLQNISNKTLILTTLFQASGNARGQQGFLNVTDSGSDVKISSAVKGSPQSASVVGSVAAQPYNISVIQISNVVVPPGLDNVTDSSPPTKSPTPAKSPRKSPKSSPSAAPSAESPPAPPPSKTNARAPASADAPTADGPAADGPAADKSSAAGVYLSSLEGILIMVSSALVLAIMI
ncbi:hypothetical protein M9H77_29158 [Catharanthus roseus]|uniref:Uncharacterized protein n=1 Tax=Catharanthus roseus TaxID=4058 RepID=A0ACC0AJC8_CATRO|nr:hypothetical protein M9H77_29158 [Catharanthus roseus]